MENAKAIPMMWTIAVLSVAVLAGVFWLVTLVTRNVYTSRMHKEVDRMLDGLLSMYEEAFYNKRDSARKPASTRATYPGLGTIEEYTEGGENRVRFVSGR
jgi:hypothetical protein